MTITDFQRNSADAKIATCAPFRRPVLSGEAPTLQADTTYLGNYEGLELFAVEYWVHHEGLRVHHSGDDVKAKNSNERKASSKWGMAETWERPRNWRDLSSQDLPLGTYTLDCALWGHRVYPAYKRVVADNVDYNRFAEFVNTFTNPIKQFVEDITGQATSPATEPQILEREISRWTNADDYSLQGLVSTEFSVVEARWGTAGLSIERGTETLPEGRELIRVRVNREETKGRPRPITAPYFHMKGPELEQFEQAISCAEGDQNHTTYLLLCWETTFDIPVNDTKNAREYTVKAKSFFIDHDLAGSFTVEAAQDAVGQEAFYNGTGGQFWVNKEGWLTDAPIGDWYGVETNARGRVKMLDFRRRNLEGNGLRGPIPPDLKDTFPFLQTLYLEGNSDLTKCIPENLFDVPTSDLRARARAQFADLRRDLRLGRGAAEPGQRGPRGRLRSSVGGA